MGILLILAQDIPDFSRYGHVGAVLVAIFMFLGFMLHENAKNRETRAKENELRQKESTSLCMAIDKFTTSHDRSTEIIGRSEVVLSKTETVLQKNNEIMGEVLKEMRRRDAA